MQFYLVPLNRYRTYIFQNKDKERAERFAKYYHVPVKPVKEVPFCLGLTIYP